MTGRKLQSAALFFVIFGSMVLLPPLVHLFNVPTRFLGLPFELIYLFAIWLGLIAIAAWFAHRLPQAPPGTEKPEADG